jgi:hypothetical protein
MPPRWALSRGDREWGGSPKNSVWNLENKSHRVTAEIPPRRRGRRVIGAEGGAFAGWVLYLNVSRAEATGRCSSTATRTVPGASPPPFR